MLSNLDGLLYVIDIFDSVGWCILVKSERIHTPRRGGTKSESLDELLVNNWIW